MISTGRYPGFRAPQGDGEILCVPDEATLPELVARNRQRPEFESVVWFGRSLADIARAARTEVLRAAVAYTREYVDTGSEPSAAHPLIVTGHQSELFHPGVWLKNFYAARLAEKSGGTALNLVIDSDLCRGAAIRVPTGAYKDVHFEMVPYDRALMEMPFEERRIADREQWESFGTRVRGTLHRCVADPLVANWWPNVVRASGGEENLGIALSRARHQLELQWGSRTLELPQSRICQSEAFRLFALQLFSRAAEFRDAHNQALADYRAAHKLKNHAQPMPDLASKEGWTETPFWLWTSAGAQRRGVFVKMSGNELLVSDFAEQRFTLPLGAGEALEKLADWEKRGIKLRTRALATTLFARLLLADVFIHGIGGAKYDQVTDHICELFLGFDLPRYATVSGTLRLPFASTASTTQSEAEIRQELWSLRFHPERYRAAMEIPSTALGEVEAVIAEKHAWIEAGKTPTNAAERHQAITRANERLRSYLSARRSALEQALAQARSEGNTAQLRTSREYAYCLFSEHRLREFFEV